MTLSLDGMFDIDALIRQADLEQAPAWTGAPLRYHEQYTTPEDLDAAFARYVFEHGHFGCHPHSHMWHRDQQNRTTEPQIALPNHELHVFSADTRCDDVIPGTRPHQHQPGELPDELMYQAICPSCEWHHISHHNTAVIEAWHDHALPGWRGLPIVPAKLRDTRGEWKATARLHLWIEEHYPSEWQQPGYPILTERPPHGTRAVPFASPWGGYDISAVPTATRTGAHDSARP